MDFQLANLQLKQLLKHTLKAFCEVNILFQEKLEIYGSVHVRADDQDVMGFLLNERALKQHAPYMIQPRTSASQGLSAQHHERTPSADTGTPRSPRSQNSPVRSASGHSSPKKSPQTAANFPVGKTAEKHSDSEKGRQRSSSVDEAVMSSPVTDRSQRSSSLENSPKQTKSSKVKSESSHKPASMPQTVAQMDSKSCTAGQTVKGSAAGGEEGRLAGSSSNSQGQCHDQTSSHENDIKESPGCLNGTDVNCISDGAMASSSSPTRDAAVAPEVEGSEFSELEFNTECLSVEVANNVIASLNNSADSDEGESDLRVNSQTCPGSAVTPSCNNNNEGSAVPNGVSSMAPNGPSEAPSEDAGIGAHVEADKTTESGQDIPADVEDTDVKCAEGATGITEPPFDANDPEFIASLDETLAETFQENSEESEQPDSILWIEGGDTYDTGGEETQPINQAVPPTRAAPTSTAPYPPTAMYARIEADNYVGLHRSQAPSSQAAHAHSRLYASGAYPSRVVPIYIPVVRPDQYSSASQRAVHAAHLRQHAHRHRVPHVRITARGPIRFTPHPAMHHSHHPSLRYPSTMFHPVVARPLLQPTARPTQNRLP